MVIDFRAYNAKTVTANIFRGYKPTTMVSLMFFVVKLCIYRLRFKIKLEQIHLNVIIKVQTRCE